MIQKCSLLRVLEVFFVEPTSIHFIKEISKRIGLAPTSVRNHINYLLKENMIKIKKSKPFDGFVANRENNDFIFYKKIYNLYSIKNFADLLSETYFPKTVILFGSYSKGEDIEASDIDIVVVTKTKKNLGIEKFESLLRRKIHLIIVDSTEKLDKNIEHKLMNGIIIYGGI